MQVAGRGGGTDVTHPGWGTQWSATAVPADGIDQSDLDTSPRGQRVRRRRRPVRHALRRGLLCAALVLAVLITWATWLGVDALHARGELKTAGKQVQILQEQVEGGDREAAASTLMSLQHHAEVARTDTHGPAWVAAGAVPWLGVDIRAVQTVSEVVDDLATGALPALLDATSLVDPTKLTPVHGRVDLAPLVKAAPKVVAANSAVMAAAARLDAIDSGALVPSVAAPLADLSAQVAKVAMTTATAARAVQLLPAMLGVGGPRQYLLLVQNNAEQRATGGEVGQVILLRAEHGVVKVLEQRSGGDLSGLLKPALALTTGERALFGDGLGTDMRDVTFTPNFPRSGALARAIWSEKVGTEVDGVLSIDPGTLADVLGATGPVTLPTGQAVTATNALGLLLNTVYLTIADPQKQDAFFAATAASVFGAVVDGRGDRAATVGALASAAREGRLMVWSARPAEQALLAGTVLSGEAVGARGDSPVIGVYLNDGTAAKIGYYLRTDVVAASGRCRLDGSQAVTVTVTLTSTAPANAADLPPYVTGDGRVVPKGEVRTNVLIYAPAGGQVKNVRVNSGVSGGFVQSEGGLVVVGRTIQLRPGEQAIISYDIVTGKGQTGAPIVRVTPGAAQKAATSSPSGCT